MRLANVYGNADAVDVGIVRQVNCNLREKGEIDLSDKPHTVMFMPNCISKNSRYCIGTLSKIREIMLQIRLNLKTSVYILQFDNARTQNNN